MVHFFNVIEAVYSRFNILTLECVTDVIITTVCLRNSTGHSIIVTCTASIVPDFLDPIVLFRASFLCEFAAGASF